MREVDDKIVYALNTSIPTESFKGQLSPSATCTDLYGKLNETYESRNKIIKNCIAVTANRVKELKTKKEGDPDDMSVYKNFKSEQRKVCDSIHNRNLNVATISIQTYSIFFCLAAIITVGVEC